MKTTANCTLILEDASFTNKENGETINYLAATLIVDGEALRVNFRKEDKSLLRVLRRSMDVVEK